MQWREWRGMPEDKVWRPGMSLGEYAALWEDMEPHWAQLVGLAMKCPRGRIVEFGTRGGVSTWAFLQGLGHWGELTSVDIDPTVKMQVPPLVDEDPRWRLYTGDSLKLEIPPGSIDMLFIDTDHTYKQTKAELELGIAAEVPVIVLHDYLAPDYPGVHEAVHEVLRPMRTTNGEPALTVMPSAWGLAILSIDGGHSVP